MPYKDNNSDIAKTSHRESVKKWCREHPEEARAMWRKSYHKNKEKHADARRQYHRDYHKKIKLEVLTYYCNSTPYCQCKGCKENYIEFLTIDHINGGGNKHRKVIGSSKIYYWLKQNNYPEGYRVLCQNCNSSLGHYGYCPHNKSLN